MYNNETTGSLNLPGALPDSLIKIQTLSYRGSYTMPRAPIYCPFLENDKVYEI